MDLTSSDSSPTCANYHLPHGKTLLFDLFKDPEASLVSAQYIVIGESLSFLHSPEMAAMLAQKQRSLKHFSGLLELFYLM